MPRPTRGASSTALELVQTTEQETAFHAWMRARAKEWVDDGILGRVAEIDAATRGTIGEAPVPED